MMAASRWLEIPAAVDLLVLAGVGVHWLLLQVVYLARNRGRAGGTVSEPVNGWPLLSVLVPAHNEERVIEATVRSLAAADYPALEILVIDDGSQDHTARIVAGLAAADARIRLLRLPQNQGKALALNAGIAAAAAEYVVVIDADTVADVGFLQWMAAPLTSGAADAVAGKVEAGHPGHRGIIRALCSIEYVSVLHMSRLIQECSEAVTIPGSAGAFRKTALQAVGAYLSQAKAEDADLSFRLVERGFRVVYQPRAVVHTEVPTTWPSLFRQRLRWIYGNFQCIFHGRTGRSAAGGRRGRYASAAFVYENLWRPPLEFARAGIPLLVLAGVLPVGWIFGFVGLLGLNWLVFAISYGVERERARELLYVPLQQVIWAMFVIMPYCLAMWHYVVRQQTPWGRAERQGTPHQGA